MKKIIINKKELKKPLVQGGMGVGVSLGNLAGNVMKESCLGVISAAHPGYLEDDFIQDNRKANYRGLLKEINKARDIANGNGVLGVNIMVALEDYQGMVEASIEGKADLIISGAGLPLDLPKYTKDSSIALAPIVSSAKALKLICKKWDRSYNRVPDLVIIEGAKAGGHLGYSLEEIETSNLYKILEEVKQEIIFFEQKYNKEIPIIVAGGIYSSKDVVQAIKQGADGVQVGTRFIATHEADCHINFKKALINANKEDIVIVKSPVGMPGRALNTPLIEKLKLNNIPIRKCYSCLSPCDPSTTPYCISKALIQSALGNVDEGLFFCGSEAYKINKIVSVRELIIELTKNIR